MLNFYRSTGFGIDLKEWWIGATFDIKRTKPSLLQAFLKLLQTKKPHSVWNRVFQKTRGVSRTGEAKATNRPHG